MTTEELRKQLSQTADYFYQERNEEGMKAFMSLAGLIGQQPKWQKQINPLFDALEKADYILAADILQHDMAEKL